jgi:hypothetical protein
MRLFGNAQFAIPAFKVEAAGGYAHQSGDHAQ